jgi:cytochrome P450
VTSRLIPELKFVLTDPDFYKNPHALLRRMRTECPVAFSEELDSWIVTRYDDVVQCLRDPRFHVVEEYKRVDALSPTQQEELAPLRKTFIEWGGRRDRTAHETFLRVMKKHFTPRRMADQVPAIQEMMDSLLLSAAARGGPVDIVNDIAHPLSMAVVCHLLGVPATTTSISMLLRASNEIAGLLEMGELDQLRRSQEGMAEVAAYLLPHVVATRQGDEFGYGLFEVMGGPGREQLKYTDDQIVAQGIMFVVVGYHTTANLLCNGLQILFDHPDEKQLLLDRHLSNLPNAFDEMMRHHGPVSTIRRVALKDITLRSQQIMAGDTVVLALIAANRDPSVFDRPDEFHVDRPNAGKQLGFTVGPYSCMGQALARLEGQVFFSTLLSRFPRMSSADPEPDWMPFRPLGRELRTLRVWLDRRR